jgi:hypothetical protein
MHKMMHPVLVVVGVVLVLDRFWAPSRLETRTCKPNWSGHLSGGLGLSLSSAALRGAWGEDADPWGAGACLCVCR